METANLEVRKPELMNVLIVSSIVLLTALIFVCDLRTALGYTVWLLYAVPLLLTLQLPYRSSAVIVAGMCTMLIVAGFYLAPSPMPQEFERLAETNRLVGIGMLWSVAIGLTVHGRHRRRFERALSVRDTRFRNFMDNSPMVAFIKDVDGRYVYVNRVWQTYFQKCEFDMVGKTDTDIWDPTIAAMLRENDAAVLASGRRINIEEEAQDCNGRLCTWWVCKFPLSDEHGGPMVGGVALDITDRKRIENELKHSAEELRALSGHLETIREEERTRIARELHDEMSQVLTGLKMDVAWVRSELGRADPLSRTQVAQVVGKTAEMEALVEHTIATVRELICDLRPGLLDHLGLVDALEWQAQEFERRTGVSCTFVNAAPYIDDSPTAATALFRILQEALTNVARHAHATSVRVQLGQDDHHIQLSVIDNGQGLPRDRQPRPQSFGLLGIRERLALLDGFLKIESTPGKGTVLTAAIPRMKLS